MPGVYLNPLDNPDDWNTVLLGGKYATPGKCQVKGWKRPVEYDHKKGKGTKGAKQTLKGLPPAEGEIEFEAWTPDHFAAWTEILELLKFDPSKGGNSTTAATATNSTATTGKSIVGTSGTTNANGGGASGTTNGFVLPGTAGSTAGGTSAFTGNTPNASTAANSQPALGSNYAIDIFHPAIADLDVAYVLPPESLGCWEEDGEASGHYKRTIKFVEYTGDPPNQSIATSPTGSAAANTTTTVVGSSGTVPAGQVEGVATASGSANASSAAKDAQGAWGSA